MSRPRDEPGLRARLTVLASGEPRAATRELATEALRALDGRSPGPS